MIARLLRALILLIMVPFSLLPVYWMLVASLKPSGADLIGAAAGGLSRQASTITRGFFRTRTPSAGY